MNNHSTYIISGGDAGAERLRVLSAAVKSGTLDFLERGGIRSGMHVLDLGCGSGEVTAELARLVGPGGRVVGIDMDSRVLARAQAAASDNPVLEWRCGYVEEIEEESAFDVVYARFLLSHLSDPVDMIGGMMRGLRPGGILLVEDIDITAHIHWPSSSAFQRYVELYAAAARAGGADPVIGPRLAAMFLEAGLADVEVSVSMPVFLAGEGKTIARRTLANIADAVVAAGLSDRAEIDLLLAELAEHETLAGSIQSTAQVFQVRGRKGEV